MLHERTASRTRFIPIFAILAVFAVTAAIALLTSVRIETGEVGLRRNFNKTIDPTELLAGSLNQQLVGDVLTFPVKDLAIELNDKHPLTAENSALKEFDLTFVYSINPSAVNELYTQKSSAFHTIAKDGDIYLMYSFMATVVNNAAYKAVRKYKALEVADNRENIENRIKEIVAEELKEQKLDMSLTINQVQVRSVVPADEIIKSANAVVTATNELRAKEIEVQTARKEAERIAALNSNANAIAYMQVQAQNKIADAIAAGKVNTIVVPMDFKGMLNVGR